MLQLHTKLCKDDQDLQTDQLQLLKDEQYSLDQELDFLSKKLILQCPII